ncbi:tetratricopeptide repeat protein [Ochrovirga pacifica]|uniref:tetratricopeptide repeat protein n=1 Tax=Ochrovirga pacifica TaxID=1042376 RepID=UPI000255987E|nr:hypothetical protein [Ochrovirga pacifica]
MKINIKNNILLVFLLTISSVFAQEIEVQNEYLDAGMEADKNGEYRKAADICLEGLRKTPYDIDLKQLLGKSYMNMKMMDSARYFLQKVILQDDNNVTSRHYLVNIEYQTKRYSSAICYVNELLEKTPYWKGLWLKKIAIYNDLENYGEVKRAVTRLRQIFPNDSVVEANYSYIMTQEGLRNAKSGNLAQAKQTYLDVLKEKPDDKVAFLRLINIENSAGRTASALEYAERGLAYYPNDLELIQKKIGCLELLERYDAAISYLKAKRTEVPAQFFNQTHRYLVHQAAIFFENTDPYVLHLKSYDLDGNRDSYNYLLGNSIDKGHYTESLRLISEGLLRNPSDKKLLIQQMLVYKKLNDTPRYRKAVFALHEKFPGDYDINQEYAMVLLEEAKEYTLQKQYQAALDNYFILKKFPDYNAIADSNIFALYALQNNTSDALSQIDAMVEASPNEKINLVKKAQLLADIKNFEASLEIIEALMNEFPEEEQYKKQYVYYSELYLKELLLDMQYKKAFPVADKSLEVNRKTKLSYTYAINAAAALKDYQKMLIYADSAVYNHPDEVDFKIKKIAALSGMKEHDKATALLEELNDADPKDVVVAGILSEERFKLATIAEEEGDTLKANLLYNSVLVLDSLNIPTYQRLVNLSINQKDTTNAMIYVNRALEIEPNPESRFFMYKKGVIFEMMDEFEYAYYYQKMSQAPKEVDLTDHLDYLTYDPLINHIGVSYLRVYSGQESFTSAVASIYYLRKLEKNEYGLAMHYATKPTGVGLQLQGTWVHKFNKKLYAQADAYYGSMFFPRIKLSVAAYKALNEGWSVNAGLGFTRLQNRRNFFNVQGGVTKELGDFIVTARLNILYGDEFEYDVNGAITEENKRLYNNIFAQGTYNINDNGDTFMAMASAGNAPQDDFSTNFQINTFTTYTNSMVGAGYRWHRKHKYTYGIQGNWYSFQVIQDVIQDNQLLNTISRVDQYHVFFVIQTKF